MAGSRRARQRATSAEIAALASAVRLRILRLTADESLTNRQLADRLERDPASVLRHVRLLVDAGFLVAEPVRRGNRGAREIPYRATGKSWLLDFGDDEPPLVSDAMLQAFLDELAASGARVESQLRVALWLTPEDREELGDRLFELAEELRLRGKRPGATRASLYVGLHRQE